jgi:hypothetical protein
LSQRSAFVSTGLMVLPVLMELATGKRITQL